MHVSVVVFNTSALRVTMLPTNLEVGVSEDCPDVRAACRRIPEVRLLPQAPRHVLAPNYDVGVDVHRFGSCHDL